MPCDEPDCTNDRNQYANEHGEDDQLFHQTVDEDGEEERSDEKKDPVGSVRDEVSRSRPNLVEQRVAAVSSDSSRHDCIVSE